jgi:LSD1 subclass zinc finger protein
MVYFVGPSTDIPDAQAAVVVKQIPLDFLMPSSLALPPPLSTPAAEVRALLSYDAPRIAPRMYVLIHDTASQEPPSPITLAKHPSLSVLSGPEPVSPSVTAGGLHVGPGGYPTAPLPAAVPPAPAGPRPAAPSAPAAAAAASSMLTIPCASCRQNMLVPLGAPAARCPACSKITRISKCKKCSGGFIFPEVVCLLLLRFE